MPHWSFGHDASSECNAIPKPGDGITVEGRRSTLLTPADKISSGMPGARLFPERGAWKTIIKTRVRPFGRRAELRTALPKYGCWSDDNVSAALALPTYVSLEGMGVGGGVWRTCCCVPRH